MLGKRNNLLTVQNPTSAPGWEDAFTIWASLFPFGGSGDPDNTVFKIETRYNPNITHRQRLKQGSRVWQIITVTNVGEENRELEIEAIEHHAK